MIKKFFLFKESNLFISSTIQKLVDNINKLLIKIFKENGNNAEIYYKNNSYLNFKPLVIENNIITFNYLLNNVLTKEELEINKENEKNIIKVLNKWILILRTNVKENKSFLYEKIDELVIQLNYLIEFAYSSTLMSDEKLKIAITYNGKYRYYNHIEYDYSRSLIFKFYIYNDNVNTIEKTNIDLTKLDIKGILELIKELEKIIELYKITLNKHNIKPLTTLEVDNLKNFINRILYLEQENKNKIKINSEKIFINNIKNNLDQDIKKYSDIPGIYMEQSEDYIKMSVPYYSLVIKIHEQYLPKIYRIYKSIKN
jgi:hypothetical protein